MLASGVIASLPVVLLFLIFQRYVVQATAGEARDKGARARNRNWEKTYETPLIEPMAATVYRRQRQEVSMAAFSRL